jgi:hypothetical protein
MKIGVNIVKVLYKAGLIAVAAEQGTQLSVVHTAVNGPLADFKSVHVHDRQHGS